MAHVTLAIAFSALEREEEARAVAAEILGKNPKFSLAGWSRRQPYKNPSDLERLLDQARKAGLPD